MYLFMPAVWQMQGQNDEKHVMFHDGTGHLGNIVA
jgi:hypothetical protein